MARKVLYGFTQQFPQTYTQGSMWLGASTDWSSFKSGTETDWANDSADHTGDVAICDNGNAYMWFNGLGWKAI